MSAPDTLKSERSLADGGMCFKRQATKGGVVVHRFRAFACFCLILAAFAGVAPRAVFAQTMGPSGNPLPRFVSVSANKAYMRTGPGRQYPVDWVYERRGLPMEVIDEFGAWRKVRDHEGVTGWMLVSLLSGKRMAMIRGKRRALLMEPALDAPVLIYADAGVLGAIETCEGLWCELTVDGTEVWVERRHLWGVYPNEVID